MLHPVTYQFILQYGLTQLSLANTLAYRAEQSYMPIRRGGEVAEWVSALASTGDRTVPAA